MLSRALPLLVASALPFAAAAEPSGFVRTDEGTVELTGPQSYFGTYRAQAQPASTVAPARAPAPPQPDESPGAATAAAAPATPVDACRAERVAYLREVLRASGIHLDDPISFLDGLVGPGGYPSAWLFTPHGVLRNLDPIAPLAWNFQLRSLARDLERCAQSRG